MEEVRQEATSLWRLKWRMEAQNSQIGLGRRCDDLAVDAGNLCCDILNVELRLASQWEHWPVVADCVFEKHKGLALSKRACHLETLVAYHTFSLFLVNKRLIEQTEAELLAQQTAYRNIEAAFGKLPAPDQFDNYFWAGFA